MSLILLLFIAGMIFGVRVFQDRRERQVLKGLIEQLKQPFVYGSASLRDHSLPTIQLDIRRREFVQLQQARQSAIDAGVLFASEQKWVEGVLSSTDEAVTLARFRLKGILNDHRETDKWSIRVDLRDNASYKGMTSFSLQAPESRLNLREWVFLEMMRREAVLAPRYGFAQVVVNGRQRGIHAWEEHLNQDWAESQQRRLGVIIKIDDRDMWLQRINHGVSINGVYQAGIDTNPVIYSDAKNLADDPDLIKQRDAAVNLLMQFCAAQRSASEVFDLEQTARFLAVCELFGSRHVMGPPNAEFYYNPVTSLLEPIARDIGEASVASNQLAVLPVHRNDDEALFARIFWPPLYLRDPLAAEKYVQALTRICEPSYLESTASDLAVTTDRYLWALRTEQTEVNLPWDILNRRRKRLQHLLNPSRHVIAYAQLHTPADKAVTIDVTNAMRLPVEILRVQVGDSEPVDVRSVLLPTQSQDVHLLPQRQSVVLMGVEGHTPPPSVRFALANSASEQHIFEAQTPPIVRVETRLLGRTDSKWQAATVGQTVLEATQDPAWPTHEHVLSEHPMLETGTSENMLYVKQGRWNINKDIILPRGASLSIKAGTILKFHHDAALIASGPLRFNGTREAPIILEADDVSWPGVVVINADKASRWEHVVVRGARSINRDGWKLTGAVTFFNSDVALVDCIVKETQSEDGINIIKSSFSIENSMFDNVPSDAVDIDFSRGRIDACRFTRIGGDAVDLSGSRVQITGLFAEQVADKAISVGEACDVDLAHIDIRQAKFGIVSKDMSTVRAEDVSITDTRYGLALYQKKAIFGPALLSITNYRHKNVLRSMIVQIGSTLTVDGLEIATESVDIDNLNDDHVSEFGEETGADTASIQPVAGSSQ